MNYAEICIIKRDGKRGKTFPSVKLKMQSARHSMPPELTMKTN